MTGLGLRDRLERLWPVGLFFNAVFQKEMRGAGRRTGTYIARGVYAALMLGLVSIGLLAAIAESHGSSSDVQDLQRLAPIMAMVLSWFGFVMLAFIAPVMTVPAFMDERRRRSLPVLMTTPLTSAQIVCAKLASQTIQLLILALLGLPVVLALRVFGGVPASFLLQSNAIVLSAALMVATIGLRFSLYRQRADVAIVGAFVAAVIIQAGPIVIIALFMWAGAGMRLLAVMPVTCSPVALATITADLLGGGGPGFSAASAWIGNTLYNLAWSALFVLTTIFELRRVLRLEGAGINYLKPRRRARSTTPVPSPTPVSASAAPITEVPDPAAAGPVDPAIDDAAPPEPAPDREAREVGDRPVLWRELRQATFRSRRGAVISTSIIAVLVIILYARFELAEVGLHMFIVIPAMLFILLRAAAGSTAAISAERDARTLESLLTTPLSAREIIWSKFIGALRRQWYIPALVFTHLLISVLAGALHPVLLLHTAIIFAGAVSFLSATGIFLGLVIRRSTTASVANICVGLILWAGLPVLLMIVADLFSFIRSSDWESVGVFLFFINPLGQLISAVEGASRSELRYGSPGVGSYDLFPFTAYLLAATLGYALVSFAILAASTRVFSVSAGRTS